MPAMQDCPKCGKKIKTLYERHGAKATYEAMGYFCKHCGILYDKELKKLASTHSTLAAGAAHTVTVASKTVAVYSKTGTVSSNEQPGLLHERMVRRPGFEPGLPDWQSDVLDQTGRPSHAIIVV